MRNGVRLLLATAILGGGVLAAHQAPEVLESTTFFQVDHYRLEGARFLELDVAVAAAAPTPGLSVWGDLEGVATRLGAHPLVAEARVRRRLPSTLVLHVEEREPVALLPVPTLVPVDAEGRLLPIDPMRHRLDLPLLSPRIGGGEELTPLQRRTLAGEVARLSAMEPRMAASLSEAALDADGDVLVTLIEPRTSLHFRPPLTPGRLREGLEVLADALERSPDRIPAAIDLRFAEQVVVRHHPRTPR